MQFQLVSGDDLALILECSTVTRRVSERIDAFEATHPIIGRLLVTVCGITGSATVASVGPLSDHLLGSMGLSEGLPFGAERLSTHRVVSSGGLDPIITTRGATGHINRETRG